ncbi:MAG: hypothetical protein ACJ77K_03030 [Bacteroidia bacterium]
MKKIISFLSVLLCFSFAPAESGDCTVKYNGIYAIRLDNEHSAILRFYADGTVLASTSVNDYFDVFTWFQKDNKDMVLTGTYKIKKCGIKFEVSGQTGEQKYEGMITGDKIDMELKDEASKKTVKRTYTFYAL